MNILRTISFRNPMKKLTGRRLFCSWLLPVLVFAVLPPAVNADSQLVSATEMDVATAVNLSGRQRMLSQRMVKAYLMLGQGIEPEGAGRARQTGC